MFTHACLWRFAQPAFVDNQSQLVTWCCFLLLLSNCIWLAELTMIVAASLDVFLLLMALLVLQPWVKLFQTAYNSCDKTYGLQGLHLQHLWKELSLGWCHKKIWSPTWNASHAHATYVEKASGEWTPSVLRLSTQPNPGARYMNICCILIAY